MTPRLRERFRFSALHNPIPTATKAMVIKRLFGELSLMLTVMLTLVTRKSSRLLRLILKS